ncbi:hypothetical protein OPT61_g3449 [Boeremia exigua]|uniref:Uncharacterized protein n=1 Tax=Boeremia exigua TaxID=749465 RepID=A0ACC2IHQ2_9PLEO|nr:hypothetical protein OPT61_g3449 [Boeremia exigua]
MEVQPKRTLTNICEDVLLMISDFVCLSSPEGEAPIKVLTSVNRRLRDIFSPILLKSLYINRPLSQLRSTPLIYQCAQSLKIDMFGSMWWWCSGSYVSSKDAFELFACMQRMTGLKKLEVSMMKRNIDVFTSAFEEVEDFQDFLLPGIETLVVTSAAAFLASHCPDLEHLTIEDGPSCMIETYVDVSARLMPLHPRLAGSYSTFPQLTHFDTSANWSAEEIVTLAPLFPHLQHLHMRSDAFCYRASIAVVMQLLGRSFKDLKTLRLNKVGNLDMGFRAVWKRSITACATEAQRRALWLQNEARRVDAENDVARLAFTSIEQLRECWLGDKRVARRLSDCRDEAVLSWAWERRREDVDVCTQHSEWANYRAEKEAVVAGHDVTCKVPPPRRIPQANNAANTSYDVEYLQILYIFGLSWSRLGRQSEHFPPGTVISNTVTQRPVLLDSEVFTNYKNLRLDRAGSYREVRAENVEYITYVIFDNGQLLCSPSEHREDGTQAICNTEIEHNFLPRRPILEYCLTTSSVFAMTLSIVTVQPSSFPPVPTHALASQNTLRPGKHSPVPASPLLICGNQASAALQVVAVQEQWGNDVERRLERSHNTRTTSDVGSPPSMSEPETKVDTYDIQP